QIPEEIAIVGFNNSIHAQKSNVPITSISFSFYEQGRLAMSKLAELLRGNTVPVTTLIPTNLVVRQSCGCPDPDIAKIIVNNCGDEGEGIHYPTPLNEKQLINEIFQCFPNAPDQLLTRIEAVVHDLLFDLNGYSTDQFLVSLNRTVKYHLNIGGRVELWQNALSILRKSVLRSLEPAQRIKTEDLFQKARELICTIGLHNLEYEDIQKRQQTRLLNQLQGELSHIIDRIDMANVLATNLPMMGFISCYIVLYDDPQPYTYPQNLPKWSRLILGYGQTGTIDAGSEGLRFLSEKLLPEGLLNKNKRFSLFISPLFFGENQFGYCVTEMEPQAFSFYQVICNQINYRLWGTYLFQKQKEVEESLARSNQELEQFAYVASHDLQEPLRKIIAFGDRLKQQCNSNQLGEQGRDYLQRMQSAATRMQVLINDLLSFSRVTTKAQEFIPVDLREVLREVLSDLEVKIFQTNAKIVLGTFSVLDADPLQMRQLFQNLVGNALKFVRPNVPPVIQLDSFTTDEGQVRIVVEDNGIGIEAAHYERVFRVFERLHGRSEYEGSGVGLAICKKIVDRHGGNIQIESTVGVGTKFIIILPCHSKANSTTLDA
ncbi:MAG TPA: ATP-binding protein, partial [Bacillota bacterium]|nr:ATP-binding protein [Bacillota bacterium]